MSDSPVIAAETPAEKKARKLAEQDQRIANAINEAATMLAAAAEDAEVQELLAPRGYDTATITDAITTLQEPAQAAFNARQVAIGALTSASAALTTAATQERQDFTDYREIARSAFPAQADKQVLGLVGKAPEDLEKFLTLAQASYAAGKKAPYTAKLTVRGYSPTAIDAELAGLKGVTNLAKARAIAAGAAQKATETRDKAAKALAAWMVEFRKVAKRTLRGHPDLLAKLGM
jgi:hypothetical protein